MATPEQIAANQSNSKNSTGPRTPEGKASAAQNNLKYGFCGSFMVLALESQEDFDAFLQSLRDEHQPATPTENLLVTKMAEHFWISRRAQHLQDVSLGLDLSPAQWQHEFALYIRYQTTHDRAFHKSLTRLLKLRTERRKIEIGFDSQKRKQAEDTRKQETHEAKLRLTNSKTEWQELETSIKETIQSQFPADTPIPFNALKAVLQDALTEVAKDPALRAALEQAA